MLRERDDVVIQSLTENHKKKHPTKDKQLALRARAICQAFRKFIFTRADLSKISLEIM